MPQIGLAPNYTHIDMEDRFCDEAEFLIFGTASAFRDCCTCDLKTNASPPLDTTIEGIFQVVKCSQSLIKSTPSLLFVAIVAVVKVEVGR